MDKQTEGKNAYEIRYETDGDERSFEVEPRFLNVNLRTEISKLDAEFQKKDNAVNRKIKETDLGKKANEFREKLEVEGVSEALVSQKTVNYTARLFLESSEKDIEKYNEMVREKTVASQEYQLKMFKLIIKRKALKPEIDELLNTKFDSEFWRGIDLNAVAEFITFFRKKEKC